MASTIDIQRSLARIEENQAQALPKITELRRRADAVAGAARIVGEAWSGSCMGHHTMLYFGDFQKPDLGNRFDVEWGTIHGLPLGWRERTVEEVEAKLQETSSVALDALEPDYSSFAQSQTELRDDLVIDLAPLQVSSGLAKEKELLSQMEAVVFDNSDEGQYIAGIVNACPRITRDMAAINAARRVPVHTCYEAKAHKIKKGCSKAEDLWRTARLVLRRLEALTETSGGPAAADERTTAGHVTNIYNLHGTNARVNIRSHDSSLSMISVSEEELFIRIRGAITDNLAEHDRGALIEELGALEQARHTPGFTQRYRSFIAAAANHMALIAPFIPALTELLKNT